MKNLKILGELYKNQHTENDYVEKAGICDTGFEHFQKAYLEEKISKEDVFYYIYGFATLRRLP